MSYEGEACGTIMEPYSTEPVTLIEEVFPQDTNAYNTLFGGRLLSHGQGWRNRLCKICSSRIRKPFPLTP